MLGDFLSFTPLCSLFIIIFVVEAIHQGIYLTALLLGWTACTSLAENKYRLARFIQLVELALWCGVDAVVGHLSCRLAI